MKRRIDGRVIADDQLANGATIIEVVDRDKDTEWVLALYKPSYLSFVVWTRRKDDPRHVFWGHYFSSVEAAADYLHTQAKR